MNRCNVINLYTVLKVVYDALFRSSFTAGIKMLVTRAGTRLTTFDLIFVLKIKE